MKHNAPLNSLCLCVICLVSACSYPSTGWQQRPVSYHKPGLWNKPHLTWRLNTLTPVPRHLTEHELHREIDRSFKSWEPGRVFTFSPSQGGRADIVVGFDAPPGKSWDGRLGSMGHASFPWSTNRGHIYLDPSEWWSTKSFAWFGEPITDWLPHEIGHALGLRHMLQPGYAMSHVGPYGLPQDADFDQLRYLYSPETLVPTGACCVTDTSGYRFSAH